MHNLASFLISANVSMRFEYANATIVTAHNSLAGNTHKLKRKQRALCAFVSNSQHLFRIDYVRSALLSNASSLSLFLCANMCALASERAYVKFMRADRSFEYI